MWQDVAAFAVVALTFGIVVARRVKQMRSGGVGAPHCARCPGWEGDTTTPPGKRAAGRSGRPLIPASSLRGDTTLRDGSRGAR
jgi:hypothetical protein